MLESFGALDKLQDFVSNYGRAFYGRSAGANARRIVLERVKRYRVDDTWTFGDETVQPFWAGRELDWQISDVSPPTMERRQQALTSTIHRFGSHRWGRTAIAPEGVRAVLEAVPLAVIGAVVVIMLGMVYNIEQCLGS